MHLQNCYKGTVNLNAMSVLFQWAKWLRAQSLTKGSIVRDIEHMN